MTSHLELAAPGDLGRFSPWLATKCRSLGKGGLRKPSSGQEIVGAISPVSCGLSEKVKQAPGLFLLTAFSLFREGEPALLTLTLSTGAGRALRERERRAGWVLEVGIPGVPGGSEEMGGRVWLLSSPSETHFFKSPPHLGPHTWCSLQPEGQALPSLQCHPLHPSQMGLSLSNSP